MKEEVNGFKKFDQTDFLKNLLWIDNQFKLIESNRWDSIDLTEYMDDYSRQIFTYDEEGKRFSIIKII